MTNGDPLFWSEDCDTKEMAEKELQDHYTIDGQW
jgi:hypothetical protein